MDALTAIGLIVALGAIAVAREIVNRRAQARAMAELNDLRERLHERRGLADMGQLVSGLAQELKSPLQAVLGGTEVMLATSASEDLERIHDDAARAAGIVRNLLAFTEASALTRRWVNLNDIVARAVDESAAKLEPAGLRVKLSLAERLPLVYVDGRQLEKAIATLITRRVAALVAVPRPSNVINVSTAVNASEERLAIDVDDPIAGDADEVLWAADLAACRHVLEAHDGALEVAPGAEGTYRFHLELPVASRSGH
jgi:two-component system, NtrC family, sensor kinase